MLSKRHVFPLTMIEEPLEDIQRFLAECPAPGIDPIVDAKVIRIDPSEDGDDDLPLVTAQVEMSVESFIRNGVQLGDDPYDLLKDIRDVCGKEIAAVAHQFIQDANDLNVAMIMVSPKQILADQWPAKPEL